jgi:hypothetical protein
MCMAMWGSAGYLIFAADAIATRATDTTHTA